MDMYEFANLEDGALRFLGFNSAAKPGHIPGEFARITKGNYLVMQKPDSPMRCIYRKALDGTAVPAVFIEDAIAS